MPDFGKREMRRAYFESLRAQETVLVAPKACHQLSMICSLAVARSDMPLKIISQVNGI